MTAKIFLQHQYSAQTRESDTFPCHNSNHQNSKTEPSDMTQNKENFYGFILQLTSKKECHRYSELISALNTFNCSFHAEAQATPNVQNIICERKNWPSFNYLLFFQNSTNHVLENESRIFWRLKSRLPLHRMNLTKSKEEDYFSLIKLKLKKGRAIKMLRSFAFRQRNSRVWPRKEILEKYNW